MQNNTTPAQSLPVNGAIDSRIGPLTFEGGYPTDATVTKLYDEMDFQRATQAYLWAIPIVSFAKWQEQYEKVFGQEDGDLVQMASSRDKMGMLTPNDTTPYLTGFVNLERTGPLLIDYPKGPTAGGLLDSWQRPITDQGLSGPDKGEGGKYLILPPGQKAPNGSEGYRVFESPTNNIFHGFRVLITDPKEAEALKRSYQAYPYANRDNARKTRIIPAEGKKWTGWPANGLEYWGLLSKMLNEEPVHERDRMIVAMLKPLGIEKCKKFEPDALQKKILEQAAVVGEAMARAQSYAKRQKEARTYPDAHWKNAILLEGDQETKYHTALDERTAWFYEAITISAGMTSKTPGVGQAYIGIQKDKAGQWLQGGNNYTLRVPPNAPAKQFWALTLYDAETRSFIETKHDIVGLDSRKDLVKNADGSVDLYVGPEAPQGKEKNWIPTAPGRGWFAYFRLYAPTEAYFDRSWKLPDLERGGGMSDVTRRGVRATGAATGAAAIGMPALQKAQSDDIYAAAREAYVFGWPLLMSEASASIATSVPEPTPAAYAPFNQLGKSLATFKAGFTDVVTVNTEVLFASAFLDLSGGPLVLSVPDMGERFWIAQLMDWWSENIEPAGSRVTGQQAQKVLIAGPGWAGETPKGMILRRVPTANAWLLPRLRVVSNDPDDVAAAGALLTAMTLEPLNPPRLDVPGRKPFSAAPPVDQVMALDGETFFTALAQGMIDNPPHADDDAMVEVLARMGITVGQPFDAEALTPEAREAINRAAADGMKQLAEDTAKGWSDETVNGWSMPLKQGDAVPGRFGTDYQLRAVLALAAFAVNAPEDAVYPNLRVDADDAPLTGDKAYVMHFDASQVPPVGPNGFWSLTLYDNDQFLVDNPVDRYAITSESTLKKEADRSFDILIRATDPGGEMSANWLPGPASGPFNLTFRVYIPGESVLQGSWMPPSMRALAPSGHSQEKAVTPAEARAIAKEAYIYGFPLVDNMRVQYSYFVDKKNPDFKAPYNTLFNIPRVFTPDDKAIQTPNSDTPYSWIGLDLRAEPIVFTVPPIAKERYWSLQLIDLYTHNFDIPGSRTTGNDGGSFLIAGPNWHGEKPQGITKVIRCETEIASAQFRTQLFNPADLDNVKKIQAQYVVKPLSAFLGQPAPKAAPAIEFPRPLTPATQKTSLEFFTLLNFHLQFCPTHPSEKELMAKFARIGVVPGKTFDPTKLSPEIKKAVEEGMADAWKEFGEFKRTQIDTKKVGSAEAFGTREFLENNYMFRLAGAVLGIYGLSKEEAIYPVYAVDGNGEPLDGSKHRYALRFAPGEFPPVKAFWSFTMYELPGIFLFANPLKRYLINSPMLPDLKKDDDGGLTLYIQNESPGKDKESNWLPAPQGPFICFMRLYAPKEDALNGKWKTPPLTTVDDPVKSA